MGVEVRAAGPADLDTLVAIHERSSRHAYAHIFPPEAPFPSHEQLAARWRPALGGTDSSALVAEVDARAVGGVIADTRSGPGLGNLRHLYVEPAVWGSGVGRALHDAVVRWCAERGLDSMELWVLERNERARAMYERWGWKLDTDAVLRHEGVLVTEVRYVLGRMPHP